MTRRTGKPVPRAAAVYGWQLKKSFKLEKCNFLFDVMKMVLFPDLFLAKSPLNCIALAQGFSLTCTKQKLLFIKSSHCFASFKGHFQLWQGRRQGFGVTGA